ncbi:MAG: hypothetical protein RJB09_1652, partial [Pseudomonadota bacterium]
MKLFLSTPLTLQTPRLRALSTVAALAVLTAGCN